MIWALIVGERQLRIPPTTLINKNFANLPFEIMEWIKKSFLTILDWMRFWIDTSWPILVGVLAVTCLVYAPVNGQQSMPLPKQEQIHRLVRYYETEEGFNGNILIAENGEIIYENSLGWADFENDKPLTINTPFYLASISKQFTAVGILILRDAGQLTLDDPVGNYFPELGDIGQRISIKNLLNHTSGLPDYFDKDWDKPGLTNAELFQHILREVRQLSFRPGVKYRYCNTSYVLLSLIIEKVSKKPFYAFFDEKIAKPAGLKNTWVFDLRNERVADMAIGYKTDLKKKDDYYLLTTGDGGIFSTLEDMFIWDQALYSEQVLSRESLEEAFTATTLASGSIRNYGYGWEIGSNLSGKSVYHTGGLAGFRTYFERQVESRNTIIILNNNSFPKMIKMRNTLVKIIEERPYKFPDR